MKKSTFLNVLIFVVALILFSSLRGGSTTGVDFGEDALVLSGPKDFTLSVNYDDIDTLELVDNRDPGVAVSGSENRKCRWGMWDSKTLGQHTQCTLKKVENAICLTTLDGQIVVFSYESDVATENILEMFRDLLAHHADKEVTP